MNLDDPRLCDAEEFRRVLTLDESEQRELLAAAEPRIRIWSAWALGLRLERGFAAELRLLVAHEPVAGVRRHLAVMLAGFGEEDIVAAMARHDADERVRGTATQYVALLARSNPELYGVLSDCLEDSSPVVRAAAVVFAADDAPPAIVKRVQWLRENDEDVAAELPNVSAPRPPRPEPVQRTGELVPYQGD